MGAFLFLRPDRELGLRAYLKLCKVEKKLIVKSERMRVGKQRVGFYALKQLKMN